jgi:geranylgeranyl reductase
MATMSTACHSPSRLTISCSSSLALACLLRVAVVGGGSAGASAAEALASVGA